MANPTQLDHYIGYDSHDVRCEGVVISGTKVLTTQQTLVADAAAATATTTAALTATSIAAAVSSAQNNVDEDGITAGGFITRAERRTFVTAVNNMITHSTEIDLDYEALLVDMAAQKVEFDLLIADVALIRTALNSALDVLEAHGLMADA